MPRKRGEKICEIPRDLSCPREMARRDLFLWYFKVWKNAVFTRTPIFRWLSIICTFFEEKKINNVLSPNSLVALTLPRPNFKNQFRIQVLFSISPNIMAELMLTNWGSISAREYSARFPTNLNRGNPIFRRIFFENSRGYFWAFLLHALIHRN